MVQVANPAFIVDPTPPAMPNPNFGQQPLVVPETVPPLQVAPETETHLLAPDSPALDNFDRFPLRPDEAVDPSQHGTMGPGNVPIEDVAMRRQDMPGQPGADVGKIPGSGGGGFGSRQANPVPKSVEDALDGFSKGSLNRKQVHDQLRQEGWSVNLRKQNEWELTDPTGRIHSRPHFGAQETVNEPKEGATATDFYAEVQARQERFEQAGWRATQDPDGFDVWEHADGRRAPRVTVKGSNVDASILDDPEFAFAMSSIQTNIEGMRLSENVEDRRTYAANLYHELKAIPSEMTQAIWRGAALTVNDIRSVLGIASEVKPTTVEDIAQHHRDFFGNQ